MMAPMQPALLALGDIQVTLTCSDGTEITDVTLVVSPETLTELTSAVEAMILYPAGLVCRLTEAPLLSASLAGGRIGPRVAFAQSSGNPNKDYAVGGGQAKILGRCAQTGDHEVNFGLSAHVDQGTMQSGVGGTVNFSIPFCSTTNGDYNGSHLSMKVDCLKVTGGIAQLTTVVTKKTGLFAAPAENVAPNDRVAIVVTDSVLGDTIDWDDSPTFACNFKAAPVTTVDHGNINVHDAAP
jgi:hypothetical protein